MVFFSNDNIQKIFGFTELDPAELNKRMSLVQLGAFTAFAGSLYSLMYIFLGFPNLAYTCLSYIAIYFINLAIFLATKNYNYYQSTQPFLILLAVFVSHIVIGGFINSSAVIFASFLAPVIALTFASQKTARVYYYLFIVSMLFAGFWDLFFVSSVPKVPKTIYTIFFITNFISIGSITYFLINGFLKKNLKLQEDLRQSLLHLKLTQSQLIQAEKMASLGELTAGIAHEIQNPLNFVNNFSEVSVELFEEMEEALQKDDKGEAVLIALDIKENLEKINHHGKRADAIVKGMLQHSRVSAGKKEATDINALADEYLRLSYHGFRAKDKDFNADFTTDFDESIGKIEVVPQDIGRVLLNLYNNAFYAVKPPNPLKGEKYTPTVWVSTRRISLPSGAGGLEITVKDNGNGIPQKVVDKIFQPFFTTKPTGEGTGLGLSLAYDIITKEHNGTISVESKEGEGSCFIINITTTLI